MEYNSVYDIVNDIILNLGGTRQDFDSTYSQVEEICSLLGITPPSKDSVYSMILSIIGHYGGSDQPVYNSVYDELRTLNELLGTTVEISDSVYGLVLPLVNVQPVVTVPYLTFTALTDNSAVAMNKGASVSINLEVSRDMGQTWTTWDFQDIEINTGETVSFRGINNTISISQYTSGTARFVLGGLVAATGDVMSLLDNGEGTRTDVPDYCFCKMFQNCTALTTAPEIGAETCGLKSLQYMFDGCTTLATPPSELKISTVSMQCCLYMFRNCTQLTSTPAMDVTNVGNYGLANMFDGCSLLRDVSNITVRGTIGSGGCEEMFLNCYRLVTTPQLLATTIGSTGYNRMFYYCSQMTSAPYLPAKEVGTQGYKSMFEYCTALTEAPQIDAEIVGQNSMSYMFLNCERMTYCPDLKVKKLGSNSMHQMFDHCNLQAAPYLPALVLTEGCYSSMFYGNSRLNYVRIGATDTSAEGCTTGWLSACASTGTVECTSQAELELNSDSGIPANWNRLEFSKGLMFFNTSTIDSGAIAVNHYGGNNPNLEYSRDGENWTTWDGSLLTMDTTELIYVRGTNEQFNYSYSKYSSFVVSSGVGVYGSVMNLLDGGTDTMRTIAHEYCFARLFYNSMISDASNFVCPATTLAPYCYYMMFEKSYLRYANPRMLPATTLAPYCYSCMFREMRGFFYTAPELPATTLAEGCYLQMFAKSSLSAAPPELPAMNLAPRCYYMMFYRSNITTAPVLPATTLVDECYYYMFGYASYVNYIKMLATDISATNCLTDWTSGVSATGTFVKAVGMSIPTGTSGIPEGWTVEEEGEVHLNYLKFTNADPSVQNYVMVHLNGSDAYFTSLQYSTDNTEWTTITREELVESYAVSMPFTDTLYVKGEGSTLSGSMSNYITLDVSEDAYCEGDVMGLLDGGAGTVTTVPSSCFYKLFAGQTHLLSAPTISATEIHNSGCEQMYWNCTGLTSVPALPATTLGNSAYCKMFSKCYGITEAPVLPATTVDQYSYESMFEDCTGLTTANVISAATMAIGTCNSMFNGCTMLSSVPSDMLPATTLGYRSYKWMFQNCTSLVTAPVLPAETLAATAWGTTSGSYYQMFNGCSNLSEVRCYATNISSDNVKYTNGWLTDVNASGTFYKAAGSDWPEGVSGIPSGWAVVEV